MGTVIEDFERCYRAVLARDGRFDGWFVTAVTSTGVYCRPSCPARTPSPANVRFLPSAAAAQQAGFRACKRCRPDAAPGSPEWNTRQDAAARAMRLIAEGVVDREGVSGLAVRLGYSARQLQRLLVAELGAGPLALARAQRAQTARILIETTDLPMASVAFAAGFDSIRQFNDTVRAVFATTPTGLRRRHRRPPLGGGAVDVIELRLAYRRPCRPEGVLRFLAARAIPGIEEASELGYRRTLRLPHGDGIVALAPAEGHVRARLQLDDLRDLTLAVQRCRRLLDLDADPQAIIDQLGRDPALRPALRRDPGRRLPGSAEPHEAAVRAVVGQQVSIASARALLGRLVRSFGKPLAAPSGGLTHLFPDAATLAGADPAALALPRSRALALIGLARAIAEGDVVLDAGSDAEQVRRQLPLLPGIGSWTADYIALRALGHPDVFVHGDLGARRAAEHAGLPATVAGLAAAAMRWRPWRSYALIHLWSLNQPTERQS